MINMLDLKGPAFDYLENLDFGILGYVIVGIFLLAWAISVGIWKFYRIEERYGASSHSHSHVHNAGIEHSHKHFHS
jgi:high-affinity nickel-transport protein